MLSRGFPSIASMFFALLEVWEASAYIMVTSLHLVLERRYVLTDALFWRPPPHWRLRAFGKFESVPNPTSARESE